jgi:hypothetical protein
MSLHPHRRFTVPEDTVRAARQAFRRGNPYVRLRDALGPLFADSEFLALYAHQGQPALSPGCLATVSVLQYAVASTGSTCWGCPSRTPASMPRT